MVVINVQPINFRIDISTITSKKSIRWIISTSSKYHSQLQLVAGAMANSNSQSFVVLGKFIYVYTEDIWALRLLKVKFISPILEAKLGTLCLLSSLIFRSTSQSLTLGCTKHNSFSLATFNKTSMSFDHTRYAPKGLYYCNAELHSLSHFVFVGITEIWSQGSLTRPSNN